MQSTHAVSVAAAAPVRPAVVLPPAGARGGAVRAFRPAVARRSQRVQLRAVAQDAQEASASAPAPVPPPAGFVPVLRPEDLPKGVRKEVRVNGKTVLMFWYRNQIYAIEARSPAEGAYSEGFIRAKFTQDFAIECPGTASLFSLKDGSIVSWYPNNGILRLLTPQATCRNMEIYPVHLGQDAISININGSSLGGASATTRGGSDTSLENNNVYGLEPKVYVEGSAQEAVPSTASGAVAASAATATVTVLAVVGAVVGLTATGFYYFGP